MKRSEGRRQRSCCSRDSGASDRWLELPGWMFDRATCWAMQITSASAVEFVALVALQELLRTAAARDVALSSNTPVSSPTGEPRNQNRGKHDATARVNAVRGISDQFGSSI